MIRLVLFSCSGLQEFKGDVVWRQMTVTPVEDLEVHGQRPQATTVIGKVE
jgi:hypothetical protein